MGNISDYKISWLVFAASLLIYIPYINSFDEVKRCRNYQTGDSWWYEEIVISIIEDQDIDMSNNIGPSIQLGSQLSISKDGYLAPKHSMFFPIATIPFYWLFGPIGALYFNLFLCCLLNVFIYKLLRVFYNQNVSLITSLLFASGTIILNYSYNYLGSLLSVTLLTAGVYYVTKRSYFLAAIILGLACFAKVSNLLWVAIISLFMVWDVFKTNTHKQNENDIKSGIIRTLQIGVILLISLLPLFITNYLVYGGIFTTGYSRIASLNENFELIIVNGANRFNTNIVDGLYGILFHPSLGLIEANPIVLISVIGMFLIHRVEQKLWFIMFIAIIVSQLLFFAKWDVWNATEFGNRFLFFSIVLTAPFFAHVLNLIFTTQQKTKDEK